MVYKILRRWIPLAFLATALCGLVYLVAQQSLRQGANDPQIQMAEDTAAQLAQDQRSMNNIVPSGSAVDITKSLAPYIVVYSQAGEPIQGTAYYPNCNATANLPCLPPGVFSAAQANGEDRITWQPAPGIRQAIVVIPVTNTSPNGFTGFVMAGRSLREVELRENHVELATGAVWFFSLGGLLILEIVLALVESLWVKKKK